MKYVPFLLFLLCATWCAISACSKEAADPSVDVPPTADDRDAPAPDDAPNEPKPRADAGYPAPHPGYPLVGTLGGRVLDAPLVTAVTFNGGYTNSVADLDAFVRGIVDQPYWEATTAEYGVGKATVLAPLHLDEAAPPTIDDDDLKLWLRAKINGSVPGFATATNQSVYLLFFPSTTIVFHGGWRSCDDFVGYHGSVQVAADGQTLSVLYGVLAECPARGDAGADADFTALQKTTAVTGHELVEAVTDPDIEGSGGLPAWWEIPEAYGVWAAAIRGDVSRLDGLGAELADMCERYSSSWFTPPNFPYLVQRSWSNAAVRAGRDPCAPYHPSEKYYFAAVPVFDPDFQTNEAMKPPRYVPRLAIHDTTVNRRYTVQGVKIGVGKSATIPVRLFSEGPVPDWSVEAFDVPFSSPPPASPNLSFAWDRTTGNNGDILALTIQVNAIDPTIGGNAFRVTSNDGVLYHTYWGYVGQE